MPPRYYSGLKRRNIDAGKSFSIVFAVIAGVVIFGCVVWGLVLPRLRKKYPPRPSSTRFNGHDQNSLVTIITEGSSQPLPSHPAVLRHLSGYFSYPVRTYNPHTETPFSKSPNSDILLPAPAVLPRTVSAPELPTDTSSHGLFSPVKARLHQRWAWPHNNLSTNASQVEMKEYMRQNSTSTDVQDYNLTLPRRPLLEAKTAGRAPRLTKQLEKFPMPTSYSQHAHPKQIFDDLEQELRESKSRRDETNSHQDTFIKTRADLERVCFAPNTISKKSMGDARRQLRVEKNSIISTRGYHQDVAGPSDSSPRRQFWKAFSPRLRNPRLSGAGTVTGPKTPVAEICDQYDRSASDSNITACSEIKKSNASSTGPLTVSTATGKAEASTPPTSPISALKSLPSLPTPLRMRRAGLRSAAATPTPDPLLDRRTPSSMALPRSDRPTPLHQSLWMRRGNRENNGLHHATHESHRTRPARLDFSSINTQSQRHASRHSFSSISSMLAPLVSSRGRRLSLHGSSVYSRDTKGMSLVRSPFSETFSSTHASHLQTPVEASHMLGKRKASSMDMLQSKIDSWSLQTPHLDLSTSPSSPLKRALSDLGPRTPLLPTDTNGAAKITMPGSRPVVPEIHIGRASDDISRYLEYDGGKLFKQMHNVEMSLSESNLSSVLGRGGAPGGAMWI